MIQEIKDFINQNIKENGKGGITGKILNSVLNKIADALPSSASAGLKNLVDGEAEGSVRGVNAAENSETYKIGRNSHAEGTGTKAGGSENWIADAHAEGYGTHADGNQAHAEGSGTYATHQAHAEGNQTRAEAESSHAEGSYSVTKRYAAHAEGHGTQAGGDNGYSGYAAHAEGHTTKAIADYSHAEGRDTEASADAAHAEGHTTKASGYSSHAEGVNTEASGSYSHAEGLATKASGYYSHAGGCDTIAKGDSQTAIGQYNKEIDAYFSVGDGKGSDNRSDAFRVEKDSRVMVKNSAGEEVHLQDFEPRSCIIRWQPQSEIKDEMYFLYHDLVYMPMFDNLQDGERHILHLDWLYEHQVALDDAERTDGGSVEYIGGERLHSVLTVRKYAGNMYCELTTKVVETTRRNDDAHLNRFHTPLIRYNYADDRTHTRASRVYLQDYIFSERFNYDGENAVGTHFKLTLVSALLDGSPVPLTQFVFADNTGNVDYYRDEEGNENGNATSDGRYVYNADSVGDTDISIKVRAGDKTQTSKFTLNGLISEHEITIDLPEQEASIDNATAAKILKNEENIGFVQNIALDEGCYYDLTKDLAGDKVIYNTFASAKIKVSVGDVAIVATRGGANGRAWALTNVNGKILSVATANANTISNPVELHVEENGYLYINCQTSNMQDYYATIESGKSMQRQINELKSFSVADNIPCMYNPPAPLTKDSLKILDIGNSYSGNTLQYLPNLLEQFGSTGYSLYSAKRASSSFKTWYDCYNDADASAYSIDYIAGEIIDGVEGSGDAGDGAALRNALNQKWDIILIHQVSEYATKYEDWLDNGRAGCLRKLIYTLRKTNPQATIGFVLIHSYRGSYSSNKEGDSFIRWQSIAESTKKLRLNFGIDFIIPYGTAIENLRRTSLSDDNEFTSDGTHLSDGLARYTAACCFFQSLFAPKFGSVLGHSWRKIGLTEANGIKNINDENALIGQTAAMLATYNMYEVQNPEGYEI